MVIRQSMTKRKLHENIKSKWLITTHGNKKEPCCAVFKVFVIIFSLRPVTTVAFKQGNILHSLVLLDNSLD